MIDTHVHTSRFSNDSKLTISQIESELNLRERKDSVCICEHMDFGEHVGNDKRFNVQDYFQEYKIWRNRILLGIEIGMDPMYLDIKKLDNQQFDYVLGSIHGMKGENLYNNLSIYGTDKISFYKKYFRYTVQCLNEFSFIDSFAHFDYVSRYTPYENPLLEYSLFKEEYKYLFDALIYNKILLEVNTKEIRNINNLWNVLQGYYEQGGRYVTIGSDAHSKEGLFKDIDKISLLVKKVGLTSVYFKKRKMKINTFVTESNDL